MNMIQKYVQNLDLKSWALIGMALIISLLIIFWPSPADDGTKRIYWDAIEKLRAENIIKDSTINLLFKASKIREQQVDIIVSAQELEIKALKTKASKQRQVIEPLIRKDTELFDYLNTQDDLLIATEQKADSLQSALNFQVGVVKQLQTLVIDKDKIQQEMYTVCAAQLDKAQRQAEKERKRKTFWKKATQVLGVIVVTETLLILAE